MKKHFTIALALAGLCGLTMSAVAQVPVAKPGEVCIGCAPPLPPRLPPGAHGITTTKHAIQNFVPVTDEMLRNPKPEDWMMYRGNYRGWGYSPLKQVDTTNVKKLSLAWSRIMEPGVNESTPLVINGMMFLGNSADVIQAIDAVTGDLMWEYRRKLPSIEDLHSTWGQRKRSIFVYGDKVYFVSWDNYLVALDARTGSEVWQAKRADDYWASNTSGPIVVKGVVIAGATCQVAPYGCYVTGNDANTGKELWRNHVIPRPGEPGDDTWGGGKVPFDKRWITGVWGPITYDPDLDLVFYGSSGVGPAAEVQRNQIGMSLQGSDTRFAVRPEDGKVVWSHQVLPEDNWDQECTFEMADVDIPTNPDPKADGMLAVGKNVKSDKRRTLVGAPCKNAVVWSFDAASGKFLWAKQTIYQNMIDSIDSNGKVKINEKVAMRDLNGVYHVCPTSQGGRDWGPTAFNPDTGLLYIPMQNVCWERTTIRADREPKAEYAYNVVSVWGMGPGKTNVGRIDAVDVATGKTRWSWETPVSNYGSVLTTGGGLVFNGDQNRYFRALDAQTGKLLWQTRMPTQVFGPFTSFSVAGKQYISATVGGGFNPLGPQMTPGSDAPSGDNAVYVFALPED